MSEPESRSRPLVIECRDVHKRFGGVEVLSGLDLAVEEGEFVALSGASGVGKSTLLHLLAALDRPTSGRIVVAGQDLAELRAVNRYRRSVIGIVFQLHNLLPHMPAGRNVELAMFGTRLSAHQGSQRAADSTPASPRTSLPKSRRRSRRRRNSERRTDTTLDSA